jgi:bifunctional non-homologous end joining protein LigD
MKKVSARDTPASGKARRRASPATREAKLPDLSQYGRLAEYNRKRHFGVTPEPPGTTQARKAGRPLEFVVQKHRASQLHYDFRLEHRGVMLSWAVPKGPSPDPSVKRLAMETEPHPMDYNQFEGVIPEGEYGGGTVMIWDKGIWAPIAQNRLGDENEADRQLKKGDLKFVLLGEKLSGSWVLVRTRGTRQWLLIKHKDEYASGEDLTMSKPLSIVSGRSMAEIGRAAGASARQLQLAAGADPVIPPPAAPARRKAASTRLESVPSRSRRAPRSKVASSTPSRV